MPEDPPSDSPRGRSWLPWFTWACFILFIIYPLSTGPALWLVDKDVLPFDTLLAYKPLEYIYDNSTIAEHAFDWYFKLWGIK